MRSSPQKSKYWTIKLSNPKIKAHIADVPGMIPFLKKLGFVQSTTTLLWTLKPNIEDVPEYIKVVQRLRDGADEFVPKQKELNPFSGQTHFISTTRSNKKDDHYIDTSKDASFDDTDALTQAASILNSGFIEKGLNAGFSRRVVIMSLLATGNLTAKAMLDYCTQFGSRDASHPLLYRDADSWKSWLRKRVSFLVQEKAKAKEKAEAAAALRREKKRREAGKAAQQQLKAHQEAKEKASAEYEARKKKREQEEDREYLKKLRNQIKQDRQQD
eukprot:CAMPEP_0117425234 /NCGR_PEP_ID=MMETSP0758-20121206/5539_1 /TAXON_ID=63605 /ORGANISM="Percolomonas cosmopolitus, Strain AE-1 (ATCC 50343)" /LENGTH=271 /DNA_ID=CAMNT_0005209581 /DNA_START=638 /DNA_END=1453 /DNA_ORIENTATION=-